MQKRRVLIIAGLLFVLVIAWFSVPFAYLFSPEHAVNNYMKTLGINTNLTLLEAKGATTDLKASIIKPANAPKGYIQPAFDIIMPKDNLPDILKIYNDMNNSTEKSLPDGDLLFDNYQIYTTNILSWHGISLTDQAGVIYGLFTVYVFYPLKNPDYQKPILAYVLVYKPPRKDVLPVNLNEKDFKLFLKQVQNGNGTAQVSP